MLVHSARALRTISSALLLTLAFSNCHTASSSDGIGLLSTDDPLYKELIIHVEHLKNGIENRDIDSIVELALPEYRQGVKTSLQDKSSELYISYFGEDNSALSLFRGTKSIAISLFRHMGYDDYGNGTTACFYDRRFIDPGSLGKGALDELYQSKSAYCVFFFRAEKKWYASFEVDVCCE